MSLIFTEGFDHTTSQAPSTLGKWNTSSSPNSYPTGRTGSGQAVSFGGGSSLLKMLSATDEHATLTIGAGLYVQGASTNYIYFESDSASVIHLRVDVGNGGTHNIAVYRGNGSTLLGSTTAGSYLSDSWHYVEVKAVLHDSTGSVEVHVDGIAVLTLTNVDTKNGGTKTVFDSFGFSHSGLFGYFDDIYACNGAGSVNTTFLGDVKIETLFPSGAGTTTQLTPSTGSNYQNVDETAPNTSDYNGSSTDDQYDTYALGNLATSAGTIYGINIWAYSAKSDSGSKGGAIMLRSGGTDYEKTDNALSTSYTYMHELIEVDPATSAAWTIANVNALEAGFKVKAS